LKYSGGSWDYVGGSGFTAGATLYNSLAIDASGNIYMGYEDAYANASVMKYNGSSWAYVGSRNFSAAGVTYTSLALNSSGTPYIAYSDAYYMYSNKATMWAAPGSHQALPVIFLWQ
jgi:hypothetical protein